MDAWLEWTRGPMFRVAMTFFVLGLLRLAALTILEIRRAVRRAGDRNIPYRKLARATLAWLLPARKVGHRPFHSLLTVLFHVSILVVPIFLGMHIMLWARGTGLSWPAIPNLAADALTLLALGAAVALAIERVSIQGPRVLSHFSDYAFPLLIAVVFGSGFLTMHPAVNPIPFQASMLIHALAANLLLIFVPFSKLSHVVLMPLAQLVSEAAWHFPPHAGRDVGLALGKEHEPI